MNQKAIGVLTNLANRIDRNTGKHFVYILWLGEEITYIGQTKMLEARIDFHKCGDKEFDSYSFHAFDCIGDAINTERALIREHKPRYNKQVVAKVYEFDAQAHADRTERRRDRLERERANRQPAKGWRVPV